MNLYLLRHGIAAERTALTPEPDRPLTPEGEHKLERAAKAMQGLELTFDLILSSPYVRARQTAEIVAEAFDAGKRLHFSDALAPAGNHKELIAGINQFTPPPENVLLVGHEPSLSELISLLLSGSPSLSIVMKKGGLCKLTVQSLKPGRCAMLEWLLTGKQLGRIT
jgi:phosphohistidine phosphatase